MRSKTETKLVLGTAFFVSFCSLSYELLIARLLSSLSLDSVTSQSVTIGMFLLALGLGAFLHSRLKTYNHLQTFIFVESLLSIASAFGIFVLLILHLYSESVVPGILSRRVFFISAAQVVTVIVGCLSGFEIPLLIDIIKRHQERAFGRVLGMSYFGGFFSALAVPYFLIPRFGLIGSAIVVAQITAVIGAIFYFVYFMKKPNITALPVMLSLAAVPLLLGVTPQIENFYLKSYYYFGPSSWTWSEIKKTVSVHISTPAITRFSTAIQDIDIVPDISMGVHRASGFHMYIDHQLQFSSQNADIYHSLMVHGALNLARHKPKNVLIIGGGDGLLISKLLQYPSLERVTLVEIDPEMIRLASDFEPLVQLNQNAMASDKLKVVNADGFAWLRSSNETFDSIFIDLPHPNSIDLSRLYSTEFYRSVVRRLERNGIMVFDFPFYPRIKAAESNPTALEEVASVLKSVEEAGLQSTKIYGYFESFLIASREKRDFVFDYDELNGLVTDRMAAQLSIIDETKVKSLQVKANSVFRPVWLQSKDQD